MSSWGTLCMTVYDLRLFVLMLQIVPIYDVTGYNDDTSATNLYAFVENVCVTDI